MENPYQQFFLDRETRLSGLSPGKQANLQELANQSDDPNRFIDEYITSAYLSKKYGVDVQEIRNDYRKFSIGKRLSGDPSEDWNHFSGHFVKQAGMNPRPGYGYKEPERFTEQTRRDYARAGAPLQLPRAVLSGGARSILMKAGGAAQLGSDVLNPLDYADKRLPQLFNQLKAIDPVAFANYNMGMLQRGHRPSGLQMLNDEQRQQAESIIEEGAGIGNLARGRRIDRSSESKLSDIADTLRVAAHDIHKDYGVSDETAESFFGNVAMGLGQLVPNALAFLAGPVGWSTMFTEAYEEAYSDYTEQLGEGEKPDPAKAFQYAGSYAAMSVIWERMGLEAIFKNVFKHGKKLTVRQLMKTFATGGGGEAITEAAQGQTMDMLAVLTGVDPDRDLFTYETLKSRMFDAGVGLFSGGGMATTLSGAERVSLRSRQKKHIQGAMGGPMSPEEFKLVGEFKTEAQIRERMGDDPVAADLMVRAVKGDENAQDLYNARMIVKGGKFAPSFKVRHGFDTFEVGEYDGRPMVVNRATGYNVVLDLENEKHKAYYDELQRVHDAQERQIETPWATRARIEEGVESFRETRPAQALGKVAETMTPEEARNARIERTPVTIEGPEGEVLRAGRMERFAWDPTVPNIQQDFLFNTKTETNDSMVTRSLLIPGAGMVEGLEVEKPAIIEDPFDDNPFVVVRGEDEIGRFATDVEAGEAVEKWVEEYLAQFDEYTRSVLDAFMSLDPETRVIQDAQTWNTFYKEVVAATKKNNWTDEQQRDFILSVTGMPLSLAQVEQGDFKITGSSLSEFHQNVWTDTIRLWKGATPLTVIEEYSEAYIKGVAQRDGDQVWDQLRRWKKSYEEATGIIDYEIVDGMTEAQVQRQLVEWFSNRAMDFAIGEEIHSAPDMTTLPAGFRGFLLKMKAYMQHLFRRAVALKRLDIEGKLDPLLRQHLQRATNQDVEYIDAKLRQIEQQQAREDAKMLPENELLRVIQRLGGLPSPKSQGAINDPLRAELRDLYDSWPTMGKTGRMRIFRKTEEGLDRLVEQLREEGFRVETPGDLLDLIDNSLRGGETYPEREGEYEFPSYQSAFHGSPHQFDKFSTKNIGTGEGAQAYGWGLYYYTADEVGEHYHRLFNNSIRYDGETVQVFNGLDSGPKQKAIELLWGTQGDKQQAKDDAESFEDSKAIKRWLDRIDYDKIEVGSKTYQVDLKPSEDEYLLWDKPLSEQSEKVREALDKDGITVEEYGDSMGEYIYHGLMEVNDRDSSMKLKSLGIRGIKYLDGNSRGKGEGDYNYVIFDEADVEIEDTFQTAPAVDTPAFKKWFGDSKVVDENGEPLVVYHGTNEQFDEFVKAKLGSKNFLAESAYEGFFFAGSKETSEAYVGLTSMDYFDISLKGDPEIQKIHDDVKSEFKADRDAINREKEELLEKMRAEIKAKPEYQQLIELLVGAGVDAKKAEESAFHAIAEMYEGELYSTVMKESGIDAREEALNREEMLTFEQRYFEHEGKRPHIKEAYLSIQNPYIHDYKGQEDSGGRTDHIKEAKKLGHDGVIFKNLADGGGLDTIYVALEPTQIKSATGNRGTFDPTDPRITYQVVNSATNIKQNPDLIDPVRTRGRTKVVDLGKALDDFARLSGYHRSADDYSLEAVQQVGSAMAEDIETMLTIDASGIGWYDRKVHSAMELMSRVHPEIVTEKEAGLRFKVMLAAISQGNNVEINFKVTDKAYTHYKKTGKQPPNPYPGKSEKDIRDNIDFVFELIDTVGVDETIRILTTTKTVKEWNEFGYKSSDELVDTEITGAMAIFGSKIGSFFGNLNGDFGTLTADLWFSRSWNRYLGNMVKPDDPKIFDELREVVRADKRRASRHFYGFDKKQILEDDTVAAEFALVAMKAYAKGGYTDKTPIHIKANTVGKKIKGELVDAPRNGSERQAMRQAVNLAIDLVEEQTGIRLTVADAQAILWYSEKDLFSQYKAVSKSGEKTDYESAAQEVVGRYGIDNTIDPSWAGGESGAVRAGGKGRKAQSGKRTKTPEGRTATGVDSFQIEPARPLSEVTGRTPEDLYQPDADPEYLEPADEIFNQIRIEQLEEVLGSGRPMTESEKIRNIVKQESGLAKATGDLLSPTASRLRRIDPRLAERFRRLEFDKMSWASKYRKRVTPYLEKISNIPEEELKHLKIALSNGMRQTVEQIHKKHGLTESYREVREVLDEIRDRMRRAGYDVGRIQDYFPRKVQNYEELYAAMHGSELYGPITKALRDAETKAIENGYKFDEDDKGQVIAQYLQGRIPSGEGKPGMTKSRTIEDMAEWAEFYADPADALFQHIHRAVDEIAKKKFFGVDGVWEEVSIDTGVDPDQMGMEGMDGEPTVKMVFKRLKVADSIDKFVLSAREKGRLGLKEEREIKEILDGYFAYRISDKWVTNIKAAGYIGLMSNIGSTMTQFGDMAFAVYEGGLLNTMTSVAQSARGKSIVTREDIGIERIGQEFESKSGMMEAVNWTFDHTGLTLIDRLGKEAVMNATLKRLQSQARKGRLSAKNQERLVAVFGGEADAVLKELKEGKVTENTFILMFSVLSDYQPISLAEMPLLYQKMRNGRIIYTLKTFTIKMLDAFRREGFDQMARGNVRRGVWQLMRLAAIFWMANVPVDWIKDWIYGRQSRLTDVMVDNLFKLSGLTRYNLYFIRENPSAMGVAKIFMPPLPFIEYPLTDTFKFYDALSKGDDFTWRDMESVRVIPFVGKEIYWHEGKGAEKIEKRVRKEIREGKR